MNEYPNAGAHAQPEVRAAVERFRQLPAEQRAQMPLLYWLLGSGTPPYKSTPEDARYVQLSVVQGEQCGNCRHAWQSVPTGNRICAMIQGSIEPQAWCRYWDAV